MIKLDDDSFEDTVESEDLLVVDVWAGWCQPCKRIAPKFADLEDQINDATFAKLDIEEGGETARALGIQSVPTFLVYKNGERVGTFVGALSFEAMKNMISD